MTTVKPGEFELIGADYTYLLSPGRICSAQIALCTQTYLPGHVEQDVKFAVLGSEALVGHVPRGSLRAHKNLLASVPEHSVL